VPTGSVRAVPPRTTLTPGPSLASQERGGLLSAWAPAGGAAGQAVGTNGTLRVVVVGDQPRTGRPCPGPHSGRVCHLGRRIKHIVVLVNTVDEAIWGVMRFVVQCGAAQFPAPAPRDLTSGVRTSDGQDERNARRSPRYDWLGPILSESRSELRRGDSSQSNRAIPGGERRFVSSGCEMVGGVARCRAGLAPPRPTSATAWSWNGPGA
jgi:hypothetical protein